MQEEFNALKAQGTWLLVPPLSNRTVIGVSGFIRLKRTQMVLCQDLKLDWLHMGILRNKVSIILRVFDYLRHLVQWSDIPQFDLYLHWQHSLVGL